jgi:hypothetical protein
MLQYPAIYIHKLDTHRTTTYCSIHEDKAALKLPEQPRGPCTRYHIHAPITTLPQLLITHYLPPASLQLQLLPSCVRAPCLRLA